MILQWSLQFPPLTLYRIENVLYLVNSCGILVVSCGYKQGLNMFELEIIRMS